MCRFLSLILDIGAAASLEFQKNSVVSPLFENLLLKLRTMDMSGSGRQREGGWGLGVSHQGKLLLPYGTSLNHCYKDQIDKKIKAQEICLLLHCKVSLFSNKKSTENCTFTPVFTARS